MCIMGDAREGKRFVMALSWVYCSFLWRYTSKTWHQELKKNADYFTAIGLVTFCDIVWSLSLWVRMESRRNTECTCNFAPRPDGDFIFFYRCFFLNIIYVQTHWNFVSAVTTCDKFLCCYCETCRCWGSGRKSVMSMRELFSPDLLAGFEKMAGFQIFSCLKIKCFHS